MSLLTLLAIFAYGRVGEEMATVVNFCLISGRIPITFMGESSRRGHTLHALVQTLKPRAGTMLALEKLLTNASVGRLMAIMASDKIVPTQEALICIFLPPRCCPRDDIVDVSMTPAFFVSKVSLLTLLVA